MQKGRHVRKSCQKCKLKLAHGVNNILCSSLTTRTDFNRAGGGALSQTTIKVSRDNTLHNTTILCCLTYAGWDYKSNFWMIWLRATELSNFARWIVAHICDRTNLREWFNPWIFKKPAVNFFLTTGTTLNWMIGVKTKNYYAKKQNELVVQNIICTHVGVVFFMICI